MKIGLFIDIDGVCTEEPANLQYANLLGVEKEQIKNEERFRSKTISTEEFGDRQVALFRSKSFTRKWATQHLEEIRLRRDSAALLTFPNVYIVSSSPSYFIEPLVKKYHIRTEPLCSGYAFDAKGLITRCAKPVNSTMKRDFVRHYREQYDITVGVSDLPEQDAAFLDQCDFSILIGQSKPRYLTVTDIEPIDGFLKNLKTLVDRSDMEIDQSKFVAIQKSFRDQCRDSKYDKNVFIMTPFRDDERFREMIRIIRQALKKKGFKGWLASDKTLEGELWANVQVFMLTCKYGIAIFTRPEEGSGTKDKITTSQFNPNVSIELGFMLSRGKEVLLLKDKALKSLPADITGAVYQNFDLDSPRQSLVRIINKWSKEILSR